MEIQPIVIGTAGHIDHGKSTLVRALTGIDPDRLKEEKERGLTIDLGFARMELPDGRWVGIVDVPGHERFIRNMVAGATGIDMVVLVVAADDGVMPQTREHLSIMQLLGVERGFIALNKVDLVDEDMVELAEDDALTAVQGTFLEGAPIVRVSALRGDGMDELRAEISSLAAACEPRSEGGLFRMPVQRVFSARGFGTIVTGIPLSGAIEVGDVVELVPGARKSKVRGIQAYHEATTRARAGHSTALNLADIDHHDVERGHVVATPGFFQPVTMLGARLSTLATLDRPVVNRMPVRVHTGTAEALGEVVLLDVHELSPGETGLVQLRMQHPLVCAPGDRFVLRLASPLVTLGGGEILESSRYRLKRFKRFVVEDLERQAASLGSLRDSLIATLARLPERWATADELAVLVKQSREDVRAALTELGGEGRVLALGPGNRWIAGEVLERSVGQLRSAIEGWFSDHPLRERIDVRDVRRLSGFEPPFAAAVLEEAARRGNLELLAGGFVRPTGRQVELDENATGLRQRLLARLEEARFQPPTPAELVDALGADEETVQGLLALLVDQGAVAHLGGELYLARECLDEARAELVANCEEHGHLEIPSLRDRLGTSRKFLIPLLEHFDAVGVTLRQGGHRVLKRG